MKKKGLAALLALVLCLCFAGYALAEDVDAALTEAAEVPAAPAEETPAAPVEEAPAEEAAEAPAPAGEVPAEEAPAAPAEEAAEAAAPAEEVPAEELPAEELPAEEAAQEPAPGETEEGDIVEIEDEETPLGLGGTATVLPQGNAEPGVPGDPFTAKVRVEMLGGADIYFGDVVTLAAIVEGASAEYTIRWEYSDGGAWTACGVGETYSFTVDEVNALYTYRAVAVEKNGDAEIPAA